LIAPTPIDADLSDTACTWRSNSFWQERVMTKYRFFFFDQAGAIIRYEDYKSDTDQDASGQSRRRLLASREHRVEVWRVGDAVFQAVNDERPISLS